MNFDEYQKESMRTAVSQGQSFDLMHASLGLTTEAGEFVSEVKRNMIYQRAYTPEMLAHMAEELGDVMWYIALAAEALGVSMNDLAQQNIDKLRIRFPGKFTPEAAEARADKQGASHRES